MVTDVFPETAKEGIAMLETAYQISGILMTLTLIIGLVQVYYLKRDLRITNERAAAEKSVEFLNWFASYLMPKFQSYKSRIAELEADNAELGALLRKKRAIPEGFEKDSFDDEDMLVAFIQGEAGGEDLINQLEFFAAAMVSGLANADIVYRPVGLLYCMMVEELMLILCLNRQDDRRHLYPNTVELYRKWSHRLARDRLREEQRTISEKMKQYEDGRLKTIGL